MSTITLPNIRQASAVTLNLKLKDNGVYVDWSGLDDISAVMFSDEQQVQSGDFDLTVSSEDGTVLICEYPGDRYEHLGVNRIIVVANYHDRQKAFDKAFGNFVGSTDEVAGDQVVIDDPVLDVEIDVADVSTSLLDAAIADAFSAAQLARALAGKTPILGADGNWYVYDYDLDQYVDTGQAAQGASIYELAVNHGYEGTEAQYVQLYFDAIDLAEAKAGAANTAAGAANEAAAAADSAAEAANGAAEAAGDAADAANEAAGDANDAVDAVRAVVGAAESAADYAQEQGDAAADAAEAVAGAADAAEAAAGAATEAAGSANAAAEDADAAAASALENGNYAKDMGDYAKQEIDDAKGEFDSLNERFEATEDAAIEVDETTDPSSAEYQDEYQRVLRVLYQAIEDARYALSRMADATAAASQATGEAGNAAAGAAAATAAALSAAQNAINAAQAAASALDSAKGSFDSVDERISAIETGKQDAIDDLSAIREGARAGATAYQKPNTGIPAEDLEQSIQETLSDVDLVFEPSTDPSDLAQ